MKAIVTFSKNIQLEIDDKDEMDTLNKAITLTNPKRRCDVCGATEGFYIYSNKDTEGNIYVNVGCKCGARSKLGQYKTGGYFWHDFEVYVKKGESSDTTRKD